MSDPIDISKYIERPEPQEKRTSSRSRKVDATLKAIAEQFIASGEPVWRVNHEALGRQRGGVAQDLRHLLKTAKTDDGVPYFHLAQVSEPGKQEVLLKRRPEGWMPPEGGERRGRPKGSVKKPAE